MVSDLNKYYYFSYTYDLTNTLQTNMVAAAIHPHNSLPQTPIIRPKFMYIWNHYLINNLCQSDRPPQSEHRRSTMCANYSDCTENGGAGGVECEKSCSQWMMPLMHGHFEQIRMMLYRSINFRLIIYNFLGICYCCFSKCFFLIFF